MICPNCEYEYVEGVTECPDCGKQLIPKEEFEGNLSNPQDWVVVYTCPETYIAEMVKANLLGADIESIILTQKDSSYPVTSGNLAVVKLLVKKKEADEALEIINDISKEEEI
ncbi:MAG: hypothetical protein A2068_08140 [Ignavibacteria bacterium GWB2_35_6b]|nr:MAG: hypothetical protein A2068_08140 [Ignavibacteria bacterium GWB2_35_6b]